jgi:glucose/mannose transport system substrate-binding protein
MAVPPAAEGAIKDAVSKFWNDDKETSKDAQADILKASKAK